MKNELRDIEITLRAHGAVLIRRKKHKVWRFPNGQKWVTPQTPSDVRAFRNNFMDLRKFLNNSQMKPLGE